MNIDPISGEKYLAGFCLACSYHCHEGHEVFELYTKRNFRCDCGNEKFANASCKLLEVFKRIFVFVHFLKFIFIPENGTE